MDAEMTAALHRTAETLATLTAAVREEGRQTRAMLQQLLEPQDASPVADALEALGQRVEALEEAQVALTAGVQEALRIMRRREQRAGTQH